MGIFVIPPASNQQPLCHREDEYDLSFVYGPESTNADVHDRTVVPLLRKFIEGYNVTILMFGATGQPCIQTATVKPTQCILWMKAHIFCHHS